MYKLQFTLKQHTPIIHFQHEQDGAALRASEVKPKLDRFIISKNGGIDTVKQDHPSWFIDRSNSDALAYKIKIKRVGETKRTNHSIITENLNALSFDSCTVDIITNFVSLREEIIRSIGQFFSVTNFGRRASKGYGSFTIQNTDINGFKKAIFDYSNNNLYTYHSNGPYKWEDVVKTEWGRLKSGKNRPYEKSRIFKYASSKKMRWEKRWMKLGILDEIKIDPALPNLLYTNDPLDCSNDENTEIYNGIEENTDLETEDNNDFLYCFYRAMLGLPELYEFRAERDHIYQFKISNETIERFKSPVTFKVFEGKVFAFPEYFDQEILGKNFQLDLILKTNNGVVVKEFNCTDGRFDISTPVNFNLTNFLSTYFRTVGFNKINS